MKVFICFLMLALVGTACAPTSDTEDDSAFSSADRGEQRTMRITEWLETDDGLIALASLISINEAMKVGEESSAEEILGACQQLKESGGSQNVIEAWRTFPVDEVVADMGRALEAYAAAGTACLDGDAEVAISQLDLAVEIMRDARTEMGDVFPG